jgi:DNA polymerase-1
VTDGDPATGGDQRPLLLALDGDGLVHRAHHGMWGSDRDALGRPTWALRGLVTSLAVATARLRPAAVLVALDSHDDPVRQAAYPGYKAHRPPREPELQSQLDAAPGLLADAGVPHACVPGHEGDDVLASAAALAGAAGWRCALVTSDRDAFALVDDSTCVLRVVDGGVDAAPVLTAATIARAYGVAPQQYRDLAALRGDTSDNLPGVPGVGAKTAARLLQVFGSAQAAFEALDAGRLAEVEAAIGAGCAARLAEPASRAAVARNERLMTMRDDLPLPALDALRLPLDRDRLVAALRARAIGLGPCLWALVGGDPPPWAPNGYDSVPRALPTRAVAPWATAQVMPTIAELAVLRAARDAEHAGAGRRPVPARRPVSRAGRPVPAGQLPLF